jgi:F0F1-type ATP synthase assembly protein I
MADPTRKRNPFRLATAGVEFIGTFALVLAGGYMLDRWLERWIVTRPAFTVWGAIIGFCLALYRLVKQAKAGAKDMESTDEDTSDQE